MPEEKIQEIEYKGTDPTGQITEEQKNSSIELFNVTNRIKKHSSSIPTYSPRNFNEQIVFYESGVTRRLYVYVNGTWRYVTLT